MIPLVCFKAGPNTKTGQAFTKANQIVDMWLDHGVLEEDREPAQRICSWWPRVDLIERIVDALLAAQGLETDILELFLEGAKSEGEEMDALALWEKGMLPCPIEFGP